MKNFFVNLFVKLLTERLFSVTILSVETGKDIKNLQKQTDVKKKPQKSMGEGIFCLFMVLFAIFEVILLTVILVRCFDTGEPSVEPPQNEETTPDEEITTQPPVSLPVFSGGVLPPMPTANANTKLISGIQSQYAVLVNAKTGEIIAGQNAFSRFSPASMTKVMTLIVACERLTQDELDKTLTMTQEVYDYARADGYADSTLYGIDVGDEYSICDLLYGIGMESASDCVLPIVFYLAESEADFVAWMNQKAVALGLKDTKFDNAIGHDSENNYTTAADMAMIMSYAMQNDLIMDILGKEVHRSTAAGYNSSGTFVPSFPFSFYSSLFGEHTSSRMYAYKAQYGKDFRLDTATLTAGKTGWTTDNYCLVCSGVDGEKTPYILVLAKAAKKYETMLDVKTIFDTYVK